MSACQHAALRMGSGGYYIFCNGCRQQWVALDIGGANDSRLDLHGTSQTPLAATATWRADEVKP